MKVYLETLGCRLNYSEMETLGRQLVTAGHHVVPAPEQADVCVLNTCAVTGEAARKSRQLARKLARANPTARLAVTGCYATLAPDDTANLPNVALVVENRRKDFLADLLQPWSAELDADSWRRLAPDAAPHPGARTRAFVKVQDGCNNRCTFCIVTVARGAERSRAIADVVHEVQCLVDEGYQEVVLTGVHLGGYGSDLGVDLASLAAAILDQTALPRLRLSSLEPWDLSPHFFDLWPASRGRLCPHLHLPVQSGSDAILRRMARRNRTDDFRQLVNAARERIPDLVLTTDLIVGFPGESEADFASSLALIEDVRFAHVHVFPYSARAGTAAARFAGQHTTEVRRQRVDAVEAVSQRIGVAVRRAFLGQVRPVLWEQTEHSANSRGNTWSGLTDNYLRVQATAPGEINLTNRITPAQLVSLEAGRIHADLSPALVE
jgi:threonylcarbamoyladenosine tRNA methylthiotransferase MtaB